MTKKEILKKLFNKESLTYKEARYLFERIFTGDVSEPELSNIFLSLKLKGETPEEIAACISVLDSFKKRFPENGLSVDISEICEGKPISSIQSAFLAVAEGVPVAKCGNSTYTAIMNSFKIPTNLSFIEAKRYFKKNGFVFLNFHYYHPAVARIYSAVSRLGVSTILDIVEPFAHPAEPVFSIVKVKDEGLMEVVCRALNMLGKKGVYVYASNQNEIKVCEVKDKFETFSVQGSFDDRYVGAAILFVAMNKAKSLEQGIDYAKTLVEEGKVNEVIHRLKAS